MNLLISSKFTNIFIEYMVEQHGILFKYLKTATMIVRITPLHVRILSRTEVNSSASEKQARISVKQG